MAQGSFIVSLDFELHWGVRDIVDASETRDYFLRARDAIPEVLRLFVEHEIHATWATVGFLFARNKQDLIEHLPELRPSYRNPRFDPYAFIQHIGENERSDPLHYARSILDTIAAVPGQEIASHTFSHYYCLEDGQTEQMFEADMRAAAAIGEPFGDVTRAIVFPRGQHNPAYDSTLVRLGVRSYRAPRLFFPDRPGPIEQENLLKRGLRLMDSYLPIGSPCADSPSPDANGLIPLPAGLFFRPYSPSRRKLEPLRLRRIGLAMEQAAQHRLDFHLWWHPHNFGSNTSENLSSLRWVLVKHCELRNRYGWASRNMTEAACAAQERT